MRKEQIRRPKPRRRDVMAVDLVPDRLEPDRSRTRRLEFLRELQESAWTLDRVLDQTTKRR